MARAPHRDPSDQPPSTEIVTAEAPGALARPHAERIAKYRAKARSPRTLREYARDFRTFEAWCREHRYPSLPAPPAVVAAYLTALAAGEVTVRWRAGRLREQAYETTRPKKVATIERAFAAISVVHQMRGHDWPHRLPLFVETLAGIRRELGVARSKKAPIEIERLGVCLAAHRPRTELAAVRDRAICCVGFFGAFRRSEVAGLGVADIEFTSQGVLLTLRRSKTDQRGEGRRKAILYQRDADVCAVRALRAWLDASGITGGPLFRAVNKAGRLAPRSLSGRAVAAVVKAVAQAGGLDPSTIAGHSLRSGFATTAGRKGKSLQAIMQQGAWTNPKTAISYIRQGTPFADNATDGMT